MKRIIALILALTTLLLSFVSCEKKYDEKGDVTVVIEDEKGEMEVYMTYLENVEHKHEGLLAVVKNLHARPRDPMHVKYTDETYSPRICEIGSLKEDHDAGKYIVFYTSVETDSYYGAATHNYGETLLHLLVITVESSTLHERPHEVVETLQEIACRLVYALGKECIGCIISGLHYQRRILTIEGSRNGSNLLCHTFIGPLILLQQ
jgi:hypothetical protein